jgi:hypothetical protein
MHLESGSWTDNLGSQPALTAPQGPRDDAAAAPARRRLKHGLYSQVAVIPGEDAAEFEAFRADLVDDLQPVGEQEERAAEQMAVAQWQLWRVWQMRTGTYQRLLRGNPGAPGESMNERLGACFLYDCTGARGLDRLSMHEVRLVNLFHKCGKRLDVLREQRRRNARAAAAKHSTDSASGEIAGSRSEEATPLVTSDGNQGGLVGVPEGTSATVSASPTHSNDAGSDENAESVPQSQRMPVRTNLGISGADRDPPLQGRGANRASAPTTAENDWEELEAETNRVRAGIDRRMAGN